MQSIDPADTDAVVQCIGRRAQLILEFGPYAHFPEVYIDSIVPGTGIMFRDRNGRGLIVQASDIESLHVYPA